MTILAIDTCANFCAAAIFGDDGTLKSTAGDDIGRGHAARLLDIVQSALTDASTELATLSRVIVTVGPGSFTGIRVGVATARGYGVALGIPVDGITTFALLDAHVRAERSGDLETSVAISGGRGQVFLQGFTRLSVADGEPRSLDLENTASANVPVGAILVGNGAPLIDPDGTNPQMLGDHASGDIAYAYQAATFAIRTPEPLYIRGADAKPQNAFALPRRSVLT